MMCFNGLGPTSLKRHHESLKMCTRHLKTLKTLKESYGFQLKSLKRQHESIQKLFGVSKTLLFAETVS